MHTINVDNFLILRTKTFKQGFLGRRMLLPQLLMNHTTLTLFCLSDLLGQSLCAKFESHKVNRKCEGADFEKRSYGFPQCLGWSKMSMLHFCTDSVSASPLSTGVDAPTLRVDTKNLGGL